MISSRTIALSMGSVVALHLVGGPAESAFVLVEDFEGLVLGSIDDQDGWNAPASTTAVAADPDGGGNQVLSVTTNSTHAYRQMLIPAGATRMVFLRFRFAGQQNYSFGLSDRTWPDEFRDFAVELSMSNASNELRVNDGGNYEVLLSLLPETWHNTWILVNNATDDYRVYLTSEPGGDATSEDLLDAEGQTVFEFRGETAGNLLNFFIKTGGGASGNAGPLYIDDIYLENTNAINLRNPTTLTCALHPADFDGDCDVDADDLTLFAACASGPAIPVHVNCVAFDLDGDNDADQSDFAVFQRSLCEPETSPEPDFNP